MNRRQLISAALALPAAAAVTRAAPEAAACEWTPTGAWPPGPCAAGDYVFLTDIRSLSIAGRLEVLMELMNNVNPETGEPEPLLAREDVVRFLGDRGLRAADDDARTDIR